MAIFGWRKKKKAVAGEEKDMSFFDHLEELRWHLFRSVLAMVIMGAVIFTWREFFLGLVITDPFDGKFVSYRILCESVGGVFCFDKVQVVTTWTSPMEKLMSAFSFSFFGGIIMAFPYVVWELWRFIKPALGVKEVKKVRWNVVVVSFLFASGVLFGYYIILPFTIKFAETFEFGGDSTENLWRISSTLNFVLMVLLSAGLIFQLPVLMFYLAKLGMLGTEFLRKYRRHAIVVLLVVAGLLTPPDPVSIFLLFFPLYFLFEIGVIITGRVEKNRKLREEREEAEEAAARKKAATS